MHRYIIIDTEGTGLFMHRDKETGRVIRSDEPGQPRMAEFAAILADEHFNETASFQSYIQPNGWLHGDGSPMLEMPEEAFKAHGLTMDFLHKNGVPALAALQFYAEAIDDGRVVLGFNQQHDGRQVRAELRHFGMDDRFEKTKTLCAMRSITTNYKGQVKKLNGKGGFPRLVDAAAHFGIDYPEDKRHTAMEDTRVTLAVARHLHVRGLLLEPAVHYARGMEEA